MYWPTPWRIWAPQSDALPAQLGAPLSAYLLVSARRRPATCSSPRSADYSLACLQFFWSTHEDLVSYYLKCMEMSILLLQYNREQLLIPRRRHCYLEQ